MTVSDLTDDTSTTGDRLRLWQRIKIPESWYLADNAEQDPRIDQRLDQRHYGRNDRDYDLDDTRSYRRRYEDQQPPAAPKVQVPVAVIVSFLLYLLTQLVGGVIWGATLSAKVEHQSKELQQLWDSVQAYRATNEILRIEVARLTGAPSGNRNSSQ